MEDAVAVAVEQPGQAIPVRGLGQGGEVSRAVLLGPEGGAGDPAGGIIDGTDQCGEGPLLAEPAVLAAIDL